MQTVQPWAPSTGSALTGPVVRTILDTIANGLDGGKSWYTSRVNAQEREAWRLVRRYTDKSEVVSKGIIKTWLRDGVLVEFPYKNTKSRDVYGLEVVRAEAEELIMALGGSGATTKRAADDDDYPIPF